MDIVVVVVLLLLKQEWVACDIPRFERHHSAGPYFSFVDSCSHSTNF